MSQTEIGFFNFVTPIISSSFIWTLSWFYFYFQPDRLSLFTLVDDNTQLNDTEKIASTYDGYLRDHFGSAHADKVPVHTKTCLRKEHVHCVSFFFLQVTQLLQIQTDNIKLGEQTRPLSRLCPQLYARSFFFVQLICLIRIGSRVNIYYNRGECIFIRLFISSERKKHGRGIFFNRVQLSRNNETRLTRTPSLIWL